MVDLDYDANVPLLRRTLREPITSVPMSRICEEHTKAIMAIARLRSDESDDLAMLPYYEGRRDALHSLLEAENG